MISLLFRNGIQDTRDHLPTEYGKLFMRRIALVFQKRITSFLIDLQPQMPSVAPSRVSAAHRPVTMMKSVWKKELTTKSSLVGISVILVFTGFTLAGLHASISTHICADYLNQTTGEWVGIHVGHMRFS